MFETYNVADNNEVRNIIEKNGDIKISFYKQYVPTYYNNLIYRYCKPITYYDNTINTGGICSNGITFSNTTSTSTAYYSNDVQLAYTNTLETGRIEQGNVSEQKFKTDYSTYEFNPFTTVTWKILPESRKEKTVDDLVQYCKICGRRRRKGENYCPKDGNKF